MASRPLRVLIAWRPGQTAPEILNYAAWLSRTTKLKIRVISVLSRGWPLTELTRLADNESWVATETKALDRQIRSALKNAGLRKGMLDDDAVRILETTSESTAISSEAEDFDADFVLIGSRHFDSPSDSKSKKSTATSENFEPGSTSTALLHYSSKPLGLAHPTAKLSKNGVTRVNVCYIDTAQSHRALNKAAELAMNWQVPLRLVSFTPQGATMYRTDNGYGDSSDLMVEWREQAMALLDRGIDRAHTRFPDLEIETAISSGNGWSTAINSMKWKKGDLLVLGSSTLGPFGRVFVGSSTTHIIRDCPVPILITPA